MVKEVSKKTGVILLLIAVIIVVSITISILNYIQTPKVVEAAKESDSSGEITLTVTEPLITKDESAGSVSLEVLPPTGEE